MSEQPSRGILSDGQLSYAGGVNASDRHPREVREDQLALGVNGTVRDGYFCVRPSFEALPPQYYNGRIEHLVTGGKAQGGKFYPYSGGAYVVFVVNGEILGLDPTTGEIFSVSGRKVFSERVPFCYFEVKDDRCIVQDGISTPRIVEGRDSRVSLLDIGEVPVGALMVDGWYRIALGSRRGKSIRFSDHEMDPTSDPLYFREEDDLYLFNGRQFGMASKGGSLVGMAYSPYLDSDTGTGPLIAFKQFETVAYDVSVPRSQWASSDISRTILPQIGACSHRAIVPREADLIFSDQRGRIRSLSSARRDASHPHVVALDRAIYPLYRNETAHLRQFRSAVEFDDRILVTVLPRTCSVQGPGNLKNVAHDAIAVLENDISLGRERSNEPVWAGLWTGIHPLWMVSGQFGQGESESGEELCVVMSRDSDGRNRFYRISKETTGYDQAPVASSNNVRRKQIESIAALRWMDFERTLVQKEVDRAAVMLSGLGRKVEVRASYRTDGRDVEIPWDKVNLSAGKNLDLSNLSESADQVLAPWNLRAIPEDDKGPRGDPTFRFKRFQMILRMKGKACVEEVAINAKASEGDYRPPVIDDETTPADYNPKLNLFTYDSVSAPAVSEPTQEEGCATVLESC